jgi:hypothetical protein
MTAKAACFFILDKMGSNLGRCSNITLAKLASDVCGRNVPTTTAAQYRSSWVTKAYRLSLATRHKEAIINLNELRDDLPDWVTIHFSSDEPAWELEAKVKALELFKAA